MIQNIIDNLKNQGIEIDLPQSNLIQKMIEALPRDKSFINKFKKNNLNKTSFYIWGEVGRGKTLIAKSFIQILKQNKVIFHYIDLEFLRIKFLTTCTRENRLLWQVILEKM